MSITGNNALYRVSRFKTWSNILDTTVDRENLFRVDFPSPEGEI